MPVSDTNPDLALYIHWPFCRQKCPYCDFNSHVRTTHDSAEFGTALCLEMSYMAKMLADRRALTSIFFGGGTPSLMPPAVIGKIIAHAEKIFGFAPTIEITAEANPTSVEAKIMTEFYHAGVNRVSMGVQSLDNDILKFLGREHDVAEALSALDTVRHSFDNLSIDLIYATAGQTLNDWQNTLSQALAFDLPHLSLYQLTIEPGTVFYTRQRNGETLNLDDDHAADLFELTQHITAAAGLPAYEISNHGKPTAQCQHNMNYWRAGDWIGIGPGAHGRFTIAADEYKNLQRVGTATRRSPAGWLQSVQKTGHGIDNRTHDGADAFAAEMIMMGLRLTTGVSIQQIETICGPRGEWLDDAAVTQAIEDGWLDRNQSNDSGMVTDLRATDAGRLRLNHIIAMILR
ncbi:MAG: radical SAM family heme chaperone HemW [Proteobacteria bacterium]|nr:radical SAM family heme chaperone HemW [Pseudomonadota bacterium]MDA0845767.1 radical SAM family heme chaperone HemW [Pseudomonadota bacterium]